MIFLREYLYVDPEKVKGIASQLFEGIPESTEETASSGNKMQIGSSRIAFVAREKGTDFVEKKSITDAIFPALEDDLEAQGFLVDISDFVSNQELFDSGDIAKKFPPGTLVRITSDARLIDPRFFARVLSGFATAVSGFDGLEEKDSDQQKPNRGNRNQNARNKNEVATPVVNIEDAIPEIPKGALDGAIDGFSTFQMRAMVKILRGIYPEGVSMSLSPVGVDGPAISVRLQEGRQYLDAAPETLFGQYGLNLQEWTVVGTIGYHATNSIESTVKAGAFTEQEGLNRGKFIAFINETLNSMGQSGFLQLPQAPGFSLIPLAVYRSIPKHAFEDSDQV
ncbi:hypothetical protein RTZ71_22285 [Rhodococcus qingshengii]|uniref:DUF6414 family protein n=1 Tax=Rhodococcus qingshengii TaxID=334542 RepID=UPI0028F21791|nr:hypothetical protein [Rhodococcus qingshengii]MDT9663443.1 hypothetical protein [Rhodococcus qingshengii]